MKACVSEEDLTYEDWYGPGVVPATHNELIGCFPSSVPDLLGALELARFPHKRAVQTVDELISNSRIPRIVLHQIVSDREKLESMHPDKYPFPSWTTDWISRALRYEEVNCSQVLENAIRYFNMRLARLPSNAETKDAETGVINLLEMYGVLLFRQI